MDFAWACKQMIEGKRVRCSDIKALEHMSLNRLGIAVNENEWDMGLNDTMINSNGWEIAEGPMWTGEDIDLAKAWYNLGFKYVFRCEFSLMMLSRETNSKEYEKGTAFQDIDYDYFPSLKVGECVALQDIIDSEVK